MSYHYPFFLSITIPLSLIAGFILIQVYFSIKEYKRLQKIDNKRPKAYRVYKEKSETEKEIDRLLDFHEKAIS